MTFNFKTATRTMLKQEYDRIAAETGDDQFFTKKELFHIPKVLADGEPVLAFSSGLMDGHTWLIALTDRRLLFLNKGLIYGLKQTSIELDKLNSVTAETGLFFGTIKIEDSAKQRKIENVLKKTVIRFTNKVREAAEARGRHSAPGSGNDDPIAKLERLAALKERGVLSEAEFMQQKQALLKG